MCRRACHGRGQGGEEEELDADSCGGGAAELRQGGGDVGAAESGRGVELAAAAEVVRWRGRASHGQAVVAGSRG